MITTERVITVNGRLENKGEWDYKIEVKEESTNPYVGEDAPPDDWDWGIVREFIIHNPLPEGAIEEELDIFYDREGCIRLLRDATSYETESRLASATSELSELIIDIKLDMASDEAIVRARELRTFIKDNS